MYTSNSIKKALKENSLEEVAKNLKTNHKVHKRNDNAFWNITEYIIGERLITVKYFKRKLQEIKNEKYIS